MNDFTTTFPSASLDSWITDEPEPSLALDNPCPVCQHVECQVCDGCSGPSCDCGCFRCDCGELVEARHAVRAKGILVCGDCAEGIRAAAVRP